MALTADANISLTAGEPACAARLQVSEIPFAGSALVYAVDGYAELNDATSKGQPFAGFCEQRILTKDHPASPADGDLIVYLRRGLPFVKVAISGVAIDDVAHGRAVFASDDGTFSFDPSGTLIGRVWALESSGVAIVAAATHCHEGALGLRVTGVKTLAATGNQTLTTGDLGKLILAINTAAHEVALPPAADCTARGFIIKKTTAAAFAVTINPDASETIDGAATNAVIDAAQDMLEIVSDGTSWHIIARQIA